MLLDGDESVRESCLHWAARVARSMVVARCRAVHGPSIPAPTRSA
jgi:hypothetical protein